MLRPVLLILIISQLCCDVLCALLRYSLAIGNSGIYLTHIDNSCGKSAAETFSVIQHSIAAHQGTMGRSWQNGYVLHLKLKAPCFA